MIFAALVLQAREAAASPQQTPSAPAGGPPPVIVISVDTLRADHLSCYGYSRLETPHLDSLAHGGTLFEEISSQAPITLPSHVSLFTSTYPFANGVRENAEILAPGATTLATVLAAHGYSTAAFIGGFSLDRRYGLAQGFETYDSPFDSRVIKGALDLKRPAPQVLSAAERWLEKNSGHPVMLFVHLFDLHQPFDAPAVYRARAQQSEYDQELAYVDDSLGGFFETLAKSGLDRRALIVLFSDHGESLGEHGENTHGYFIYRSTLHVPLIFHWPQRIETGNSKLETGKSAQVSSFQFRVSDPAGLIDVAPTILSFLGIPAPASFCGHSLLDLAKGDNTPPRDVYSESFYAHDKFGWAGLRSLRQGDYKYIDAPRPELYDLKRDPAELQNLLPAQTAMATSLRERLAAFVATFHSAPDSRSQRSVPVAPEAAESLRSLGYLEITSPQAALNKSGIDPKNRVFEYKRYLLAEHLGRTGKTEEAIAEYRAILADDPRNLPASIDLTRLDVELHRYLDGANRLQAALALDPHNIEAAEMLGDIWLTVGDSGRAAAEFQHLLTFAPNDYEAHFGLALLATRRHDTAEATAHFRAALATNPLSAEAHYQLGLILEAQHQKDDAVHEFEAALQNDPQFRDARRELSRLTSPGQ
jgi:arylsulfatase A-like enzyme/thioredoxin-like negative regulator of GroEL